MAPAVCQVKIQMAMNLMGPVLCTSSYLYAVVWYYYLWQSNSWFDLRKIQGEPSSKNLVILYEGHLLKGTMENGLLVKPSPLPSSRWACILT